MDCRELKKELEPYLRGRLPESRRLQLEDHILACPACASLLAEYNRFWNALENRDRIQPSPYYWARLQRRIRSVGNKKSGWGWWEELIRPARPAIAFMILLAGIFAGYTLGNFPLSKSRLSRSELTQSTETIQNFFQSYNFNLLNELPAGSIEEIYFSKVLSE